MLLKVLLQSMYIVLLLHPHLTRGAFFQPTAYTFPDGLQSVNGSSSTGGCQPESCVMMPYSTSTVNGCDCPGTTPVSGVLIDGDIPSIDITQHGTWASELFVVNRNGQDSVMIGFQFSSSFFLRHVEVVYLDCHLWGTGLSAINVRSSQLFPNFLTVVSTSIGMLFLDNDTSQSCSSLEIVSIPLQPTSSNQNYFIEFISSALPLSWLHLAEIRFSDVAPTAMIPTTLEPSESATLSTTNTLEANTTIASTNEDDDMMLTTTQSTNLNAASTGRSSEIDTAFPTSITAPTRITAIPVPVFVGTLVGVAAVLILLIVIISMLCIYLKRAQGNVKQDKATGNTEYDDVIERGTELSGVSNPIEMKGNEAYGEDNNTIVETPLEEVHYEEIH